MKCPKCKSVLSLKNNRCERCGEDVRIYRRVVKASNAYYNQGLAKAKVRDLSGAVESLKKSLELDKRNTNARNLLGLVYYEMGEIVSALSEWVISKHFDDASDNIATEYMNSVQSNPTKLESINQAIKKYNSALASAKQGSGDLAIIQLKKVVNLNPKFVAAYQLLALLYLQSGDKDKAEEMIRKANQIDINNIVTLRYMKEIGMTNEKNNSSIERIKEQRNKEELKKEVMSNRNTEYNSFTGMKEFKEEKHNVLAYVNLMIGIVLGIVVAWFLILPQVQNGEADKLNQQIIKYQEQINNMQLTSTSSKDEVDELKAKVEDLTKKLEEAEQKVSDAGDVSGYDGLLNAMNLYSENKKVEAALALKEVDEAKLTSDVAKTMYATIKENTFESAAKSLYQTGYRQFNSNKFDEALENFQNAITLKSDYADAIYFVGRCYDKMGDKEKAREMYESVIRDFPGTSRANKAEDKLNALGQ